MVLYYTVYKEKYCVPEYICNSLFCGFKSLTEYSIKNCLDLIFLLYNWFKYKIKRFLNFNIHLRTIEFLGQIRLRLFLKNVFLSVTHPN